MDDAIKTISSSLQYDFKNQNEYFRFIDQFRQLYCHIQQMKY